MNSTFPFYLFVASSPAHWLFFVYFEVDLEVFLLRPTKLILETSNLCITSLKIKKHKQSLNVLFTFLMLNRVEVTLLPIVFVGTCASRKHSTLPACFAIQYLRSQLPGS